MIYYTLEEVMLTQAIENEALVNILEKKRLLDKKELPEEMKELRDKFMK
jgi:hypothetical protein